ncbi:hypothetical protein GCM10011390_35580 [Aureimonas endophytica]|uniref:Uncharacterized protein n=1 Tax=Aureimonas endophytica TaxID=2027858 RepID=A0A916ZVE4_9HYPH|nr:hypothetical protein [Aureimonas endophytica]GGE13381.1 hypothetical protein GCM10011390_35580 [Aureimonas endophytica]
MTMTGSSTRHRGRKAEWTIGRAGRRALAGLAAAVALCPPAGAEEAAEALSRPRSFAIADSFCFMPCLDAAKSHAQDLRSARVTISRVELSGPMIAHCDGKVAISTREGSEAEVMDELHRRYGEAALTSAAQIVLPAGPFRTGTATCAPTDGRAPTTFARLLSVEPQRITLLTESGVVYELVPVVAPTGR